MYDIVVAHTFSITKINKIVFIKYRGEYGNKWKLWVLGNREKEGDGEREIKNTMWVWEKELSQKLENDVIGREIEIKWGVEWVLGNTRRSNINVDYDTRQLAIFNCMI